MKKKTVEEFYNEFAAHYAESDIAPSTFSGMRIAFSFADDITWHFLEKYAPKRKSCAILDAGAGEGYWAAKFLDLGYKNITLTDISNGMLEHAKKRISSPSVSFIRSDISNMKEIGSNSFGFVFSQYDAVSYCSSPARAMRELSRVAKRARTW